MTPAVQFAQPCRPAVRVAADLEGLRLAIRELMEEEFHAKDDERTRRNTERSQNRDRVLRNLKRRTLSPGYYDRAFYLVGLADELEIVTISGKELAGEDCAVCRYCVLNEVNSGPNIRLARTAVKRMSGTRSVAEDAART